MSHDLREEARNDLRRVLAEMESLAPLAPELEERPVELTTPRRSRPQPVLAALGAAAAVFALALPVVLLSTAPDAGETAETAPSATVPASSEPATSPSTAMSSNGWSIRETPTAAMVAAVDDRFVAAATKDLVDSEVLTSENGIDWQTAGSLGEGAVAMDIAWKDGIVVAAGLVIAGTTDADGQLVDRTHTPTIWTSTDHGVTWAKTEIPVADVTATPEGFAAVGVEMDNTDPDYNKTTGILWTSPDGINWTEVARSNDPEGVSSNFRNVVFNDQLVILGYQGEDGVSEGSRLEESEPHANVTWFSDGTHLSEPEPSSLVGYHDADSTAVTPHGIIATTHWSTPTAKTEAAAWISQDGTTWTRLDIEPGSYEYTDVAFNGDTVFITGYEILDGETDDVDTALWSSSDAVTWTREELPELPTWTRLQHVAATATGLVIAGDNTTGIIAGTSTS